MMKDIQEKRIENELNLVKSLNYPHKIKKQNKDEYYIDIAFPSSEFNSEFIQNDISFLIHILPNFPFSQPRVFCKTHFCFPHISDGRDILEDIIGQIWEANLKVIDVINKIPLFIKEFVRNLQEGVLVLIGNYYLGEKYDLSLFESLPVFTRKVKEKIVVDGKEKEFARILVVSDIFFLIFEQEKWTKNNLHLIFWSNIRSLVTIKKVIKGDTCRFFWKQKNKKKHYEMIITLENSNDLVNLMLDKMSKFGINYKVSKNMPKQGTLPAIDIDTVEKSIMEIENKVENNPDMELMQFLMSLYEKAVEYYSATNNPKYEYYTKKIQETLQSPRINQFLDSDREANLEEKKESKISAKEEEDVTSTSLTTNVLKSEIEFDKSLKNEEKGVKMEITYDESSQKYHFSDEEEDVEEDEEEEN